MRRPEMQGPIRSVLLIHNAIQKEAQEFEEAAKDLNREDTTQVKALLDRFKFFSQILKVHENSEELVIFPELDSKYQYFSETYMYDHQRHTGEYDGIVGILNSLGRARGNKERIQLAQNLHRQAIAMNVVMDLHIHKENELLYPLYDMTFTTEEQRAMEMKINAHMPPDFMPKAAPWIFRLLNVNDRQGLIYYGMNLLPPEHLAPMMKLLAAAVTPPEWEELRKRVPELTKLGV